MKISDIFKGLLKVTIKLSKLLTWIIPQTQQARILIGLGIMVGEALSKNTANKADDAFVEKLKNSFLGLMNKK